MTFYFEVWLAIAFLAFGSSLFSRRFYVIATFPIFGLITLSSAVALFSVSVVKMDLQLGVLTLSAFFSVAVILILRPSLRQLLRGAIAAGLAIFSAAAFSLTSQFFGLAGVGFSDGFTILTASLWFQDQVVQESPLVGFRGLKRGIGISAVQALGESGEYLVGLIPLIFAIFIVCSSLIIYKTLGTKWVAVVLTASLLTIAISTEAILRHLYLMNSHALIGLAFAVATLMVIDSKSLVLRGDLLILAFPMISTVAFARLDALIIFLPLVVPLAIANYRQRKSLGLALILAALVPTAAWLSIAVIDFPVGGQLGVFILCTLALGLFYLTASIVPEKFVTAKTIAKLYLWSICAILVFVLVLSDLEASSRAMVLNFYQGEGLWGATLFLVSGVVILSLFLGRGSSFGAEATFLLRAGVLSLLFFLIAKVGDGQLSSVLAGDGLSSAVLARSGWGDSLNRMLVAYLPFFFLLSASLVRRLQRERTPAKKTGR